MEKTHENLVPNDRIVRPNTTRQWKEDGRTAAARDSFTRSTAKIWNQAPLEIKNAKSIGIVKKLIKDYCTTLPI